MTRAKFKCSEIAEREGWGEFKKVYAAKLHVVHGGSEENKAFFAATPSGSIEVGTMQQGLFEVGKEYYVDFTPCEVQA